MLKNLSPINIKMLIEQSQMAEEKWQLGRMDMLSLPTYCRPTAAQRTFVHIIALHIAHLKHLITDVQISIQRCRNPNLSDEEYSDRMMQASSLVIRSNNYLELRAESHVSCTPRIVGLER